MLPREIPWGFLVEISGLGPREALDKAVVEAQEMTNATHGSPANSGVYEDFATDMRVEQKVHERGFLCVSLWVCN